MKKVILLPLVIVCLLASGTSAQAAPIAKKPESTGSAEQQAEAKDIVADSTEFAEQRALGRASFEFDDAIVNVKGHYASVGVNSLNKEHSRVSVYFVDLKADRVVWDRTLVFTPASGGSQEQKKAEDTAVDIKAVERGEVVYAGTIGSDGTLDSSAKYSGLTDKANKANKTDGDCAQGQCSGTPAERPGDPSALGFCEWAVGALCGTGGGAACYGACIALGLVSGPGGLGCAAVCALIASLGCTAATNKICG